MYWEVCFWGCSSLVHYGLILSKPVFASMHDSTAEMIEKLVSHITERLRWGNANTWTNKDFVHLEEQIWEETHKRLSVTTLKRLWGRAEQVSQPSHTTLDILAEFGGFESWRDFLAKEQVIESPSAFGQAGISFKPRYVWIAGILLIGLIGVWALWGTHKPAKRAEHTPLSLDAFSFKRTVVAEEIPNSVVFAYDATASNNSSSIEIQQSWDDSKRIPVSRGDSIATCIYYRPGHFKAKLVVDSRIVAEDDVLIPTLDWLGVVEENPVPIYLPDEKVQQGSEISISPHLLAEYGFDPKRADIRTSLYKVSDFEDLYTDDFTLDLEVRQTLESSRRGCGNIEIWLLYDGGGVSVPLANKGCVANLGMMTFEEYVEGSRHDLSAFGVEVSKYQSVRMKSQQGKLEVFLNGQQVYQMPVPKQKLGIKGISVHFEGVGGIRNISLSNSTKTVYASESAK